MKIPDEFEWFLPWPGVWGMPHSAKYHIMRPGEEKALCSLSTHLDPRTKASYFWGDEFLCERCRELATRSRVELFKEAE